MTRSRNIGRARRINGQFTDLQNMMQMNWKSIIEGIGLAAIVASSILVAMELRQNTAVATANALSQLNAALDASYRARAQDPVLAALIMNGHADYDSLSELEQHQFAAWLRADMNHLGAIWINSISAWFRMRHLMASKRPFAAG